MAVTLRIDLVQGTQSVANNNSKVRARVYAISTYGSYNNDQCKGTFTLDGIKYNFSHSFAANTTTLLYDTTKTVQHNTNGTKTVNSSATFATGVSSGTISASKSLTLTKINRRSQLNSIPKFTLENGTSISITKYVSSYSDTLRIYKGNTLIKTITNITNGYHLNFTEEELNTLYGLSPNSNTISLTFTLTTYDDSTVIGSTSVNVAGIIQAIPPTFLEVTTNDSNEQTLALTGNNQKYVSGYSTLHCIIKAVAQKKATISNFTIDGNMVNASYDGENDVYYCEASILNISKNPIQIYATDSRNNSSLQSITLNYIEYNPIEKGNIKSIRENNVGEAVNLEFEGNFWNNNFNEIINNSLTVQYFYKNTQESSWTQGTTTINLEINENKFSFSGAIKGDTEAGFDINYQYDLKVIVSDKLSKVEFYTTIIAGKPAIAIFENRVALNDKYDENLGGLQLYGDTYFNKNLFTLFKPKCYVLQGGMVDNGNENEVASRIKTTAIWVKPNTTYTIKADADLMINVNQFTKNSWISGLDYSNQGETVTFTTDSDAEYIRLGFHYNDNRNITPSDLSGITINGEDVLLLRELDSFYDTGWITMKLVNCKADGVFIPKYKLIGKTLYIRGSVLGLSGVGKEIYNFPELFRVSNYNHLYKVPCNGTNIGTATLHTNGNLIISNTTATMSTSIWFVIDTCLILD